MTGLFRTLLFGIGALALIAGIVVGVIWFRGSSPDASPEPDDPGIAVLAMTHAVAAGSLLRESDMFWLKIAVATAPANSFVRGVNASAELVGALSRHDLAKGEIVTSTSVLRSGERGFLAATLAPGFRAVTIAASAEQSASGLVLPGDRVDVILVQNIESAILARKSVGETVLSNARVLATGRVLGPQPKKAGTAEAGTVVASAESASPATITLEVLPEDAERLVVASGIGKLELALRAVGEAASPASMQPVWAGDVSLALRSVRLPATAPAQVAAPPLQPAGAPLPALAPAAAKRPQVLIIRGPVGASPQ